MESCVVRTVSCVEEYTETPDSTSQLLTAAQASDLMLDILADGLDHPELWESIPAVVQAIPDLVEHLQARLSSASGATEHRNLLLLIGIAAASLGHAALMREELTPLGTEHSQSPVVQGALFHLDSLLDPANPKYRLTGKICRAPFRQIDILDTSSHLCCASWLGTSIGDMTAQGWRDVWNSENAQAIRESVHDGSYRYCNKGACPKIQAGTLETAETLASVSSIWGDLLTRRATVLETSPEVVNLAYDRTCNLSCPSCRTERYAADDAERERFDDLQERAILPLLKGAKTVFVTGSGDPFASKNFRRLMQQLTAEDYPKLRFQIMTNGMLFTPRQWASFPSLHRRVSTLKISIDAATGPTHERLRRGARWSTMLDNMAFAGQLAAAGDIDQFDLVFVVQSGNFAEMGDAVDLAKQLGATGIYFARLTNWGTFSHDEYRRKAVFLPMHVDHPAFLACMKDERLQDPIVLLGDLAAFAPPRVAARVFEQ